MRAVVTGGAGMIGSHLADRLVELGWDVVILDNLSRPTHQSRPGWLNPHARFVRGDIRDVFALTQSFRGAGVVFHQAAVGGFAPTDPLMGEVNVSGTLRVMDAARHAGVIRVVLASSQAVYAGGAGMTEATRTNPRTFYGQTKLAAEQLALKLGEEWGLPTVALRYALTYGPRQSPRNPYTGICANFAARIRNGLPPLIYEDGQQTRDFTYVSDVVEANVTALELRAGFYNVGTGIPTTVIRFARELAVALGSPIDPVLAGERRPQDARHVTVRARGLRAAGWRPTVALRSGLGRFAAWYLTQPLSEPADASEELRAAGVLVPA